MKKSHVLLVVLLMLTMVIFAACNNAPIDDPNANQGEDVNNVDNSNEEDATISRGAWDGSVFTSEFSGITFTLPANWVAGTDEQLGEAMGMGIEGLAEAGADFSEEMLQMATVNDMMAFDMTTGNNVLMIYENLTLNVGGISLTEEQYLQATAAAFASLEMDYTFGEVEKQTIGTNEYYGIAISANVDGIEANQYMYARKIDNYLLLLAVTIMDGTAIEDILANFS